MSQSLQNMVILTNTVSGKRGSKIPEEAVAEIKAPEELSIDSEGQGAKVNVSEETPVEAVRDEGIVVDHALTKTADTAENGESEPIKYEATATEETPQDRQPPLIHERLEDKNQAQTAEDKNTATLPPYLQSEDKMDITPEATESQRGKKRSHGGDSTEEPGNEVVHVEQGNGNEAKRSKIENGDATTNGHAANGHTQSANGDSVETKTNEGGTLKKDKGSSRPKRVDMDVPQAVVAEAEETIARRTRSKA